MTHEEPPAPGLFARLFRRRQYRTSGLFLRRFRCWVVPEPKAHAGAPVRIVDCNQGGAALLAPPGGVEPPARSHCYLRVRDEEDGRQHEVVGYVVRAARQQDGFAFAVSFVDFDALAGRLDGEWWRLFNRRRVFRARLRTDEALRARFLGGGLSLDARVRDLSLEGVGLEVEREHAAALEAVPFGWVHLAGDRDLEALGAVSASLRHVTPVRGAVRLGLAWMPDRTREWTRVHEGLARFVNRRQARAGSRSR